MTWYTFPPFLMLADHNPRWLLVLRRLGWASSLALALLLMQSAFWSERVPLVLKLAVAGVAVLAAVRPAHGLLVVAALAPLGHFLTTRVWDAYPFALSEALVLAFFAGYLWQRRPRRSETRESPDGLHLPAWLFSLVVISSGLVQLAEIQVWHDFPLSYSKSFADFLTTEYLAAILDPRPWVDGRTFVSTAALLVEGVALLLCVRSLCAQEPALARRLTNVVAAAGATTATLSLSSFFIFAANNEQPLRTLIGLARWSPSAIPSLNSAGPYFMLVAFVAIGIALASAKHRLPWILASVVCIAALWLTRTRSAMVAGLATSAACAVWLAAARLRWPSRFRTGVATLVAIGLAISVVLLNPLGILPTDGGGALRLRALFAQTALRAIASSPIIGIGVGRYVLLYPEFASPELLQIGYLRSDAHNYFLWIGAELGLIGLGLFAWLVVGTLIPAGSPLRTWGADYWRLGVFSGLVAFIITWSIGQPLSIPQVAYTFWILLGAVAAQSREDAGTVPPPHRYPLFVRLALAATVVLIVSSVPVRAHHAIAEIDLSRVRWGFYNRTTVDGRDFQWAGPRARLFMRSSVRAITIPVAAKLPDMLNGADVDVLVNGRLARHLELRDKEWHDVRLTAPASAAPFWQIDLNITPIDVRPDLEDARRRVAVATISVEPQQAQP